MSAHFALYPVGQKSPVGEPTQYLGKKVDFPDHDYWNPRVEQRSLLTSSRIQAIRVINNGAGTLAAGSVVKWKAGQEGWGVDVVTSALDVGAGVIDPYISSAVAVGEHVWLFVYGPARCTSGAAITAGAIIIPGASGRVITQTGDVNGVNARCGRAETTVAGAALTVSCFLDFRI
jgi:hypothetical protein